MLEKPEAKPPPPKKNKQPTAQYVLNITMRKQTKITLIRPHSNNWMYKGTQQHGTQNQKTFNRTTS